MKNVLVSFILIVLFNPNKLKAQNNNSQAAIYNIGLGSFFGGFGAIINKKPNEKLGKVFIKGFWQGGLGGYVTYESKKLISDFSNSGDFKDAWGSKILNSIGNSMINNAANNKDFWEKGYLHFGFNRFEFTIKDKFKINYKIMPLAFLGTVLTITEGKFDLKNTLKTGQFIFKTNSLNTPFELIERGGQTAMNSILILDNYTPKEETKVLAHEIIHVYQYNDFLGINTFFNPLKESFLNNDNKVVQFYRKWFYSDFNGVLWSTIYALEYKSSYEDNYLEREADYYSFQK